MGKALLFAALVATASQAFAANPDLRKALKLYDDLDYMPALDALQAADARPDSTRKEKVEIQIYMGMILITLGDETKARAAFAKAIALDRQAKPPKGASPKVAKILDQVRAEAPAQAAPVEGGVVGGVVGGSTPTPTTPTPTTPTPTTPTPTTPTPAPTPAPNEYPPPNPYAQPQPTPQYQQPAPYPYATPYYAPPPGQQPPPPQGAPYYAPPPGQQSAPAQQGAPYYAAPPGQQAAPAEPGAPYAQSPDQQAPVASTSAPAETGSSNTWSAVTGFSALGVGAVGIIVGVVFQLQTNSAVTDGNAAPDGPTALADQASASQDWTYTLVGYVAGGVLMAAGLTLVIVHYASGPSHPSEPHAGQLSLTPSGVALTF